VPAGWGSENGCVTERFGVVCRAAAPLGPYPADPTSVLWCRRDALAREPDSLPNVRPSRLRRAVRGHGRRQPVDVLRVADGRDGEVAIMVSGVAVGLSVFGSLLGFGLPPGTKDVCMDGGWRLQNLTFRTQGQCVAYVATQQDDDE
jgi:hypothetical protein